MMAWFLDPVFLIFMLPGLLLSLWASFLTKSTFQRYAKVAPGSGFTGAQAAHRMLARSGVNDVRVEPTRGFLSDHYDPRNHVLRLSPDVYSGHSLSAIGVACHEAGHALQHAAGYAPLGLRTALVPAASVGSYLGEVLVFAGIFFRWQGLFAIGAVVFGAAVLFTLITLPVEWNASARAKREMVTAGIVTPSEAGHAGKVLNAAFLTYVAGAVAAIMQLLYMLLRAGAFGRDD